MLLKSRTKLKTVGEQEHISCASTDVTKLTEKKRNAVQRQRTEMMLLMEVMLIMMREAIVVVCCYLTL